MKTIKELKNEYKLLKDIKKAFEKCSKITVFPGTGDELLKKIAKNEVTHSITFVDGSTSKICEKIILLSDARLLELEIEISRRKSLGRIKKDNKELKIDEY